MLQLLEHIIKRTHQKYIAGEIDADTYHLMLEVYTDRWLDEAEN